MIDKNSPAADEVLNISNYQKIEEKKSSDSAAFEQVMLQMNIANRNDFDDKYQQLWVEASESSELLAILLCEIDFFDEYNQHYGHQAAAFMLLVTGLALKQRSEELGCFLARYEGNKFAILCKGEVEGEIKSIADALRLSVENTQTEHKHSSVSSVVTLSVGVSHCYPKSMKIVTEQVNSALLQSKMAGRNRVSSAQENNDLQLLSSSIPLTETELTANTIVDVDVDVDVDVLDSVECETPSEDILENPESAVKKKGLFDFERLFDVDTAPSINKPSKEELAAQEKQDQFDRFMFSSQSFSEEEDLKSEPSINIDEIVATEESSNNGKYRTPPTFTGRYY